MKSITISFSHHGHFHEGEFCEVYGAGVNVWHLSINGYYAGSLNFNDGGIFIFNSQKDELKYLTEYFGRVVLAAYE